MNLTIAKRGVYRMFFPKGEGVKLVNVGWKCDFRREALPPPPSFLPPLYTTMIKDFKVQKWCLGGKFLR